MQKKIQREHGGSPCFTKELLAAQLGNDADALDVVLEFMEEKGWASNFIAGYWRIGGSSYQEPHRWAAERWT